MTGSTSDANGWSHGYATALDYTYGLYPHQFPEHLDFWCLLHGVPPPCTGRDYDYCELGCGRAATVSVLAAANPQARFVANDFMPSHVAAARQLAGEAGLANLTLLEASFEDLADPAAPLPTFDYITLQGVYTWVSPEVRAQIVRIAARRLKPGGMLALGYNSMPGWSASLPLQRLMQASTQWQAQDGRQQVERGRELLRLLRASGAEYCKDNPAVERRLAEIENGRPAYLQHEYLNRHWEPMFHADVARELAAAKLEFVGSAVPPTLHLTFPPEQQALLDAIPDRAWRETARDYLLGTPFRFDLFVRGRRALAPDRRRDRLAAFTLALAAPVDHVVRVMGKSSPAYADLVRPVLDRLADRPHTLEELGLMTESDVTTGMIASLASMLLMKRHASLFSGRATEAARQSARAWNRRIAGNLGEPNPCTSFASPLTGGGIDVGLEGLAVYAQRVERPEASNADIEALALEALQVAGASADPARRSAVSHALDQQMPIWRQLDLL